ncbi:MAG TPA: LTA synthase family protein [Bacilli bacterium]
MNSKIHLFYRNQFFFYSLVFLAKISFVRFLVFDEMVLWKTLLIELVPVLLIVGIVEFLFSKRLKSLIYVLLNLLLSTVFLTIILYHEYYGTLITYTDLFQANQIGELTGMILSLIKPGFLLVYADLLILILWVVIKKSPRFIEIPVKKKYTSGVLFVLFAAALVNIGIHNNNDIINEMKKAEKMGILSFEVLTVYAENNKEFEDLNSVTLSNIKKIKDIQEPIKRKYAGVAKDKNIIIVQLEAFQNFVVGLTIGDQEVTPNLNRLMKESFYFPNFNSQIGKGNTSDAEFMINTSIYPMGSKVMSKEFGKKIIPSFPRLLKTIGYETITLHTNDVSFWNRIALYPALGFDKYYDKQYFGEADKITFGSSDEVLYTKTMPVLTELKDRKQKFYAHLIAMSSHGPFKISAEKIKIKVPGNYEDTLIGDYIEATNYADSALGQFIDELKANGIWDDSIIVIYGDHFGIPMTIYKEDKLLLAELLGREYTRDEIFNIPLFIRIPGVKNTEVNDNLGGQVDVMPTLANLIGLSLDNHIHFGQDLFNHRHNLLGERFYLPTGSFINDQIMFIPGEGFKDGMGIRLDDHSSTDQIEKYEDDFNRVHQLLELSDAYMNSLPDRPLPPASTKVE